MAILSILCLGWPWLVNICALILFCLPPFILSMEWRRKLLRGLLFGVKLVGVNGFITVIVSAAFYVQFYSANTTILIYTQYYWGIYEYFIGVWVTISKY
jgi:hypothetical protein